MPQNKTSSKVFKLDPEPIDDTDRLYKLSYYNGLTIYAIGKTLKESLSNIGIEKAVRSFKIITNFKELIKQYKEVTQEKINNREVYRVIDFECYHDEYCNNWYCVNTQTQQTIKLI